MKKTFLKLISNTLPVYYVVCENSLFRRYKTNCVLLYFFFFVSFRFAQKCGGTQCMTKISSIIIISFCGKPTDVIIHHPTFQLSHLSNVVLGINLVSFKTHREKMISGRVQTNELVKNEITKRTSFDVCPLVRDLFLKNNFVSLILTFSNIRSLYQVNTRTT